MRTFHSYGPIDSTEHYFTVWGARQTGKIWLYRQNLEKIKR
jgi:hypothetical protein